MLNKRILVLMFLLLFLPLVGCFPPPTNQTPILTSDPITIATVGIEYIYDVNATDPDGDTLTYSLAAKPMGMTINSATGLIKWIPVAAQVGNNSVIVKVSDGSLSITQDFIIKVSTLPPVVNQAPVIYSTPTYTATIGVLYTYDVNATDPDGDTLIYSLAVKPTGMTISSASGLIKWTPVTAQIGNNSVTVKISDGSLSITQNFTIKVSTLPAVNQAPVIISTPVTTATVGITYFYDVNATDPNGDTLTYSLTACPGGMVISSANGLIMWTPIAKGTYTVVVEVSDGTLSDTQGFTIVVSEPTVPVETYTITSSAGTGGTISPLGDVTVNKGANIGFNITPNTNYNIADVLVDGGSVGAVASYTFTNVAKDHTIHATFSAVEVKLTGIVVLPETMALLVGEPGTITSVTAYYSDGSTTGIALGNCTYSSSVPEVATVIASEGYTVNAIVKGITTITVDYAGKSDTIVVTVSEPTPVNHAPVITPIPGLTAILGLTFTYDVEATDPDNDVLTYSLTVKPVGMAIGPTTGVISWIPNATGDYDVTVKVSDGELSDTQPFTVTVVTVELTGIEVKPDTMILSIGESKVIESVTATYKVVAPIALEDCTYGSSNPSVATVSDAGKVKGVTAGGATITVAFAGKEDTIVVTVFLQKEPVYNSTQETYHTKIQDAIDEASDDDIIEVAAGTYNERLTISRPLDLRGAPGNDSVITLAGLAVDNPNVLIEIPSGVSNVSVTGFTLIGSPTYNYPDESVIRCWEDNIVIEDNIMDGYVGVLHRGTGDNLGVHRNRMVVNKNGVVSQNGTGKSNVTISDNTITLGSSPAGDESAIKISGWSESSSVTGNTATGFIHNSALAGSYLDHLTVSGNTFTGNARGVCIWGSSTFITITDNVLSNSVAFQGDEDGCGISIKGSDLVITGNQINNNANIGVRIDRHQIDTERVTISNNNITGNSNYGVWVNISLVTEVVDATENWWGSEFGPKHDGYPENGGDTVSDNVDYSDWNTSSN